MYGFKCKFQFMKRKETLTGKSSSEEAYSVGKEVMLIYAHIRRRIYLFLYQREEKWKRTVKFKTYP